MRNDTIIMDKNKIYTSYFARASKIVPDKRLVSIALSTPENWGGTFMRELNPSPILIHNIKNGIITEDEYEAAYRYEVLSTLNPEEIANRIVGKVVCCWERTGEFCHRRIVIKWIEENLGEGIIGGEI